MTQNVSCAEQDTATNRVKIKPAADAIDLMDTVSLGEHMVMVAPFLGKCRKDSINSDLNQDDLPALLSVKKSGEEWRTTMPPHPQQANDQ